MRLESLSLSAVLQILNQEITKYRSLDNFNLVTDIAQFNNRSVLLKSDDFHCYTTHILIQLFWIKKTIFQFDIKLSWCFYLHVSFIRKDLPAHVFIDPSQSNIDQTEPMNQFWSIWSSAEIIDVA